MPLPRKTGGNGMVFFHGTSEVPVSSVDEKAPLYRQPTYPEAERFAAGRGPDLRATRQWILAIRPNAAPGESRSRDGNSAWATSSGIRRSRRERGFALWSGQSMKTTDRSCPRVVSSTPGRWVAQGRAPSRGCRGLVRRQRRRGVRVRDYLAVPPAADYKWDRPPVPEGPSGLAARGNHWMRRRSRHLLRHRSHGGSNESMLYSLCRRY
jgi:hypothetical protein